jgi:lipopolysaccharide export system protein LptA
MPQADPPAVAVGLLALCMLAHGSALALSSDRNEPVYIEADQATLNEQEGTSSYSGNVSLRQGTLQLAGDSMQVQLKDNRIELIVLQGSPARFVQRPDGADTDQEAEARHIEYHATSQRLLLEQDAHIRQVGKEEFSSDHIEFNLADNSVHAGGTDGRVRITLQPEVFDDEETPDQSP